MKRFTRLFTALTLALFVSFSYAQTKPAEPYKYTPPPPPPPAPHVVKAASSDEFDKLLRALVSQNEYGAFKFPSRSFKVFPVPELKATLKIEFTSLISLANIPTMKRIRGGYSRDLERIKDDCKSCFGTVGGLRFSFDKETTSLPDEEQKKMVILVEDVPLDQGLSTRVPGEMQLFIRWPSLYVYGQVDEAEQVQRPLTSQLKIYIAKLESVIEKKESSGYTHWLMGKRDWSFKRIFIASYIYTVTPDGKIIWQKLVDDPSVDAYQLPTK